MSQGSTRGIPISRDSEFLTSSHNSVPSTLAVKTYADTKLAISVTSSMSVLSSSFASLSLSSSYAPGSPTVSASYALSASYSPSISSSYSETSSYSLNAPNLSTGSRYFITSSWSTSSISSSYASNSNASISSSYISSSGIFGIILSSSYSNTSSVSISSSNSTYSTSGSYALNSNSAITASYITSSNVYGTVVSSSYAGNSGTSTSSSFAVSASAYLPLAGGIPMSGQITQNNTAGNVVNVINSSAAGESGTVYQANGVSKYELFNNGPSDFQLYNYTTTSASLKVVSATNEFRIAGSLVVYGSAVTFTGNPSIAVGTVTSTVAAGYNNMVINGVTEAGIILKQSGTSKWQIYDNTIRLGFYNFTTAAENLTILQSSGNVGIGVTSPISKLDVAGNIVLRDGTNSQTLQVYGTYTDTNNYQRLSLSSGVSSVTLASQTAGTGVDDIDVVLSPAGTGSVKSTATISASTFLGTTFQGTSSFSVSSSNALSSLSASYAPSSPSVSASYASTSSWSQFAGTLLGSVTSASYALSSSYSTDSNSSLSSSYVTSSNVFGLVSSSSFAVSASAYLPLAGGSPTGNIFSSAQIRGSTLLANAFNSYDNGYSVFVVDSGDGKTHVYGNGASLLHLESNNIEQRNGTTAQSFRVYGTYTDNNNYVRAALSSSSTSVGLAAETAGTGADNINIVLTPAGSGMVGIGTSNPSYKLDVNGTIYGQSLTLGGNQDHIGSSAGTGFLDLNTSQGIKLNPGNAFLAHFTSTGKVGIGTATPGAKLHITSSTADTIGQIVKGAASQTANLAEWQNSSGTTLVSVNGTGDISGSVFKASVGFTGSLFGSSSYALSASYAPGSPSVSASYASTSSWSQFAGTLLGSVTSASYATTSSYISTVLSAGNDRLLTSNGSVSGSNAESNFTFDGTTAVVSGSIVASRASASLEVFRVESRTPVGSSGSINERTYQFRVATTGSEVVPVYICQVPAETVMGFDITTVSRRTGSPVMSGSDEDGGFFKIISQYNNIGGVATIVGSDVSVYAQSNQGTWTIATASDGADGVLLNVTGAEANDITWHATVKTYSVIF